MALKKVLIVNRSYPAAGLELLMKNGVQPTVLPLMDHTPNAEAEIAKNFCGFDALVWNTKYKLTGELLDLAGSEPFGESFKDGVQMIESGEWKPGVQWILGQDIAGSTIGVVGFGGIGQAVVRRLRGFDVGRFIYSGRTDKPEAKTLGAERVPVDQLLKESDYVILCCPLTNETKHLINADSLKLMKKTAVLVNIARGDVIDHEALLTALKENTIFAAGLDVTTPEPLPPDHPLVALPNCYIIPHLGSATVQTRNNMACIAATNIISALEGKPMQFPVV